MWRYAGLQKFEFGEQIPRVNRKGDAITRSEWGLVVSCEWRITGLEGDIVGSHQFGADGVRADSSAKGFYRLLSETPPMISAIDVSEDGSLRFEMSGGYVLTVAVDIDSSEEQWRFMQEAESVPHLTFEGGMLLR